MKTAQQGSGRLASERGASLVEVVVGLVVLTTALLGLAGTAGLALQQSARSGKDIHLWAALQGTVDSLVAVGAGSVTDGSTLGAGYPMSWVVSGTNPQRIDVYVDRKDFTGRVALQDTLVLYLGGAP